MRGVTRFRGGSHSKMLEMKFISQINMKKERINLQLIKVFIEKV